MSVSPCFSCGKELKPIFEDLPDSWQPDGANRFITYGQYGSEFDPMDGSYLQLNICDECITTVAQLSNRVIYVPKDGDAEMYRGMIV